MTYEVSVASTGDRLERTLVQAARSKLDELMREIGGALTYGKAFTLLSRCVQTQMLDEDEASLYGALFAHGATVQDAAHVQAVIRLAERVRSRTEAEATPPSREASFGSGAA
jgi:hypothetical protein